MDVWLQCPLCKATERAETFVGMTCNKTQGCNGVMQEKPVALSASQESRFDNRVAGRFPIARRIA